MTVQTEIKYASVDELMLDPMNPRLGRTNTGRTVSQSKVIDLMKDWTLEELATSFMESGFWPQEALLVVREKLYGRDSLVVVEGNRRLAALKFLQDAVKGNGDKKWTELVTGWDPHANFFKRVPYLLISSRKDVEAFLGFRHVTGIKEWRPAEKAEFIAHLIEERGLSYKEVTRKIGSKLPAVRSNYISYRLLLQMENRDDISIEHVEEKFSVLFLSLRTEGVKKYLHVDIQAEPSQARTPVPKAHLRALANFARWLFGTDKSLPIVKDSRQVDHFGKILESKKAVDYLERTSNPSFEIAYGLAGGDEPEVVRLIERAADNVEAALSRAHLYAKKSSNLRSATERLGQDVFQLLVLYPDIREQLLQQEA